MKELVSVIIPTYGSSRSIIDVIKSVMHSSYRPLEIVVVDNGLASDIFHSVEKVLRSSSLDYKIIKNAINLGTAAGRNVGARVASGKFLFFLDHDIILDSKAIETMMQFLKEKLDYGIVGPLIYYYGMQQEVWWSGGTVLCPSGRVIMNTDIPLTEIRDTDVVPAAMMVSIKVFNLIGGFYEEYFSTFEDSEFCFKAKRLGYKVACIVRAVAYHYTPVDKKSQTVRLLNRIRLIMRNRFIFIRRNCDNVLNLLLYLLLFNWFFLGYYFCLLVSNKKIYLLKDLFGGTKEGLVFFFKKEL